MTTRLAAAWAAPAAVGAGGPRLRDFVLVAVFAAVAVVEGLLRPDLERPFAATLVTIAVLPGLLWRRIAPLPVLVGMTAISVGYELTAWSAGVAPGALAAVMVMLAVPYGLFRWGSGRARIVGSLFLLIGIGVSFAVGTEGIEGVIAGVAIVGGACLIGVVRRQRIEARARELDHARSREREALARDLHDTVAHHVSAIAIRAQAASALPPDAVRSATAFAAIEREAREALAEMRALVRNLRDDASTPAVFRQVDGEHDGMAVADDAPLSPMPGLAELARLADPGPPAVSVAGVETAMDSGGRPAMPSIIANALFRIAQEAVSNARRHARGATRIEVEVVVRGEIATLSIRDDGDTGDHGAAAAASRASVGFGIRGMTERAVMLGGGLRAGTSDSGGWLVVASIPLTGDPGVRSARKASR